MATASDRITFTDDEIATLNAARVVLWNKTIDRSPDPESARAAALCEVARDAIFRVFVQLYSGLGMPLTNAQMHDDGYPPRPAREPVEPQSLRA